MDFLKNRAQCYFDMQEYAAQAEKVGMAFSLLEIFLLFFVLGSVAGVLNVYRLFNPRRR